MLIPQWFIDGGLYMHLIVMALFVAIIMIVVAGQSCRSSSQLTFLKITLVFVFMPAVLGISGFYIGYIQIMSAVPMVDPSMKQEIYDASMTVARYPLIFGGLCSLFLLLIWFVNYHFCKSGRE